MLETIVKMFKHAWVQFGDMELYTGLVVGAMILVWIVGSIVNRSIASSALRAASVTLESQFSEPGKLSKESNSHFFSYSTGRRNCSGAMVSLKLSPRQDFISRFCLSWVWKTWYPKDRATIEIFDAEVDSAVTLFVCRKWQQKALTEKIQEVQKFCKQNNGVLEGSSLGNFAASSLTGFTCLCDAGGKAAGSALFPRAAVPESLLKSLESLYVSSETRSIKLELDSLPASTEEWKALLEFLFGAFLDTLATVKVAESVRAEVTAQRSAEATKAARESELAKRREELEKQKSDQLKNLSAAERERMEEKKRLKERKKNARAGRIMLQ